MAALVSEEKTTRGGLIICRPLLIASNTTARSEWARRNRAEQRPTCVGSNWLVVIAPN
jgi:hypothetical protein